MHKIGLEIARILLQLSVANRVSTWAAAFGWCWWKEEVQLNEAEVQPALESRSGLPVWIQVASELRTMTEQFFVRFRPGVASAQVWSGTSIYRVNRLTIFVPKTLVRRRSVTSYGVYQCKLPMAVNTRFDPISS